MNNDGCIITINGTDYYYPCSRRDDIILVGNSLVNVGASQITLYHQFPEYNDNTSGYPRITMPVNSKAYIRTVYNGTNTQLNVSSAVFKSSNFGISFYLQFAIFLSLVLLFFKKRG